MGRKEEKFIFLIGFSVTLLSLSLRLSHPPTFYFSAFDVFLG